MGRGWYEMKRDGNEKGSRMRRGVGMRRGADEEV